jgi:conjugative relaxase-like TrwC/TraI family protein
VTVRVTTLKGHDAGAYYVEALPSYYLDAGEPPGAWRGSAAGLLGLEGEVDDDAFLALMGGLHPGTGELLGRRYGDDSVRAFDITASAPKSVSVLFALGDDDVREAIVDAHDRAVGAMVEWVECHAHTRYRIDGEVAVVDAEGIVAAWFRQHTSRALDPQLHTHVVVSNRVRSPDGRWLALDARTIKLDQRTLSALYHAGLRAELTRTLGVAWREPVHGIAELAWVPEAVLVEFSSRTDAVRERREEKLERFCERFGRDPTPRERWRLEREAVADSRPPKTHGVDAESLHDQWADRARTIGYDPARVVTDAIGRETRRRGVDVTAGRALITDALEALTDRQSTWRPAELVRELAAAVPTDLDVSPERLVPWLDQVADWVTTEQLIDLSPPVPEGVPRRRDGRPVTESVVDRALTTPAILAEEERLVAWADKRIDAGGAAPLSAPAEAVETLTAPQQEAAAAVAGDQELVLVVGPAGTGKTTALAPAVAQLRAEGRAVFGVTPSATAAEVLAVDAGVAADTLDKLLVEHSLERRPDHRYDLPAGATLIVDEAAMVATPKLAQLADLADARGWRLALVGDPLQFSAVGRSGMFGHLAETFGAIELARVQRFAHSWERDASLRLRRGDQSVLDVYDEHGRLHGGTRRQVHKEVVQSWWAAHRRGETTAMMTPTNEVAHAINLAAQRRRAQAGELDLRGRSVSTDGYQLYVGDVVATRHNDRQLRTDRGLMVKNRHHWHITAVHRSGAITVSGHSGTVRLPAEYVRDCVELAYAETSHAAQGRTVDRAFLLLDGPTDTRGVYVPMTRGRLSNEAFVVLDGDQTTRDVLAQALSRHWIDEPAVARRAELQNRNAHVGDECPVAAQRALGPEELRDLFEREDWITRSLTRTDLARRGLTNQLAALDQQRAQLEQSLVDAQRRIEQAHRTIAERDRPLKRHRWRFEIDIARSIIRDTPGVIDHARHDLLEHQARRAALQHEFVQAGAAARQRPALEQERQRIRGHLDADFKARTARVAIDPPTFLTARLGPRPDHGAPAALWDETAARIDQHRTAFGITDTHELLGPQPGWRDRDAFATSHRAAAEACQGLDRAFGRDSGVEPPRRGLSIGL